MSNDLAQELGGHKTGEALVSDDIVSIVRKAAAEGAVLLKNNGTLPIKLSDRVSVFGRTAIDYFAVGYGSGGDVQFPYAVNIIDGLISNGVIINEQLLETYRKWTSDPVNVPKEVSWGNWPMNLDEMPLDEQTVKDAESMSDMALVVIGRAAGEDRENLLEKGSYYLTDAEVAMLDLVTERFSSVAVIMDCGNIIDMSWVMQYGDSIGAILYAWQGGMEGGNAIADVLTGRVNPCGKLSDTIAASYESLPCASDFGHMEYNNYVEDIYVGYRYFETFAPEKVMYPFGFGLSYTSFEIAATASYESGRISIKAVIKNIGDALGREVVQVYVSPPQGVLGKPKMALAAFHKTAELRPMETEEVLLSFLVTDFASYDDSGITGFKSAYVLEKGEYAVSVGNDVRSAKVIFKFRQEEFRITRQLSEVMAVCADSVFKRLINREGAACYEEVPIKSTDLRSIILDNLPDAVEPTGDTGLKLIDVQLGKCSMDQFIAQLTMQDLDDISRGEGEMNSPLGVEGNAGALGGVTESLRLKGISPIITADGPAGIRLKRTCSLLPCGTALACTFDTDLVASVYAAVAYEMKHYGVDVLLAPGMNIHRNPLCGRNFEYFSEDPLLCGKMAAAVISSVQASGLSCAPKHFACNNQEMNRNYNDSRVSERALREIYLKCFEIAVIDSSPHMIMTSYNKINGVWSHYNYELIMSVLRGEWGFKGLVITDWWMRGAVSPEFFCIKNDAYRVRAGVDVLMPGSDSPLHESQIGRHLLDSFGEPEGITLGELQRTARHVLEYALATKDRGGTPR